MPFLSNGKAPRICKILNNASRTFSGSAASISEKVFDNDKETIFRAGTKYNSFTTGQVRQLITSFQFEENKLKMAKLIFPQVQDKQNYHQLKDCFRYIGWQSDFLKFLNQQ